MRHTRFELGFPRNRKVSRLSDAAFRLYVSAIDHAREQRTDGELEASDLATIPRGAGLVGWKPSVVRELVDAGLWDPREGGWCIHDFLVWQDSKQEVDKAREQARDRMRRVRPNAKQDVSQDVRANIGRTSDEVTPTYSDSDSTSDSDPVFAQSETRLQVGSPREGLEERAQRWVQDPLGAALTDPNPQKWPETQQVVATLTEVFGGPEQRPRHASDPRMRILLERWAEGRTTEELILAVRGAGKDDQIRAKPQLQTLTTILRDSGQVDRYARLLTVAVVAPVAVPRAPTGRAGEALERQLARAAEAREEERKALP